ncbi:hypothetical protein [uncultured Roseibium sp.]|uniref:hypothetical protein n=1 Tax=uncultured Roseibium sp. TaxID=1936171 RepID=UPI003216975A
MITINLISPILVGGERLLAIDIRPPSRAVVQRISAELDAKGQLPIHTVPGFAARLAGRSESTFAKLSEPDLLSVRKAVMTLHRREARRLRARKVQRAARTSSLLAREEA